MTEIGCSFYQAEMHNLRTIVSIFSIQVLKGMGFMNSQIFRRHLREFYPLLTKLVCCDQVFSCKMFNILSDIIFFYGYYEAVLCEHAYVCNYVTFEHYLIGVRALHCCYFYQIMVFLFGTYI